MITSNERLAALMSGAVAGTAVDFVLFPLDTMKTRLQSAQGFQKAGGFTKIYSGLGSAMAGSAPNAAIFFLTYETVKSALGNDGSSQNASVHMMAASLGEMSACLIRVPVEVVKQRSQARSKPSLFILRETIRAEGIRGLYRGYLTTVFREIPFSIIQFPLWEYFKLKWSSSQGYNVEPWQATICGAAAGGIAAAITTPLDVAKTRVMLAPSHSKMAEGSLIFALRHIYQQNGLFSLFAGMVPRILWISLGGAIFLGGYEKTQDLLRTHVFHDLKRLGGNDHR